MKIAVLIVRILFGVIFLLSSIVVLFNLVPPQELHGDVKVFMEGVTATGYLLKLIKITELICAIAILANRFVPLALVILFPITINIFLYHIVLAPEGAVIAIVLLIAHLFLAWDKRSAYEPLFRAK